MALENPQTGFGASINLRDGRDIIVENCRFTTTFTDQTDNGIFHGIGLRGKNITFRNNYQDGAQVTFGALGVDVDGVTYVGNVAVNCNDYAVSAVSGHGEGLAVRNVLIQGNRIHGSRGGGYIYVGSDSIEGEANPDVSDVIIADNILSGPFVQGFLPLEHQSRRGITVSLGHDNRRITVRGNTIANDAADRELPLKTQAILVFVRNSDGGQSEDIAVTGNVCDFTSGDEQAGVQVEGSNLKHVQVSGNIVRGGTRGIEIANANHVDFRDNVVEGATSAALTLRAPSHDVTDINIENCRLETTEAFRPSVLINGEHDVTDLRIFRCRLLAKSVSIQNNLTSPAALQFSMNFTTTDRDLGSGAVPDEGGIGNSGA
jgi:hypothetical protein